MSLREGAPERALPTTHYFLSLSRGDAIRTVMLRPAGFWAIAAKTVVCLVVGRFLWSLANGGALALMARMTGGIDVGISDFR